MANMFELMKSVVLAKRRSVEELTKRIDAFWAQGRPTDGEKAELDRMVFENQTVDAEKGELDALYRTLVEKYNALEARVLALEGGVSGGGGGTESGYPAWEPWDGVSLNYQPGAIVEHRGKLWINVLESMQNVWEPGVVDERYWTEYIA